MAKANLSYYDNNFSPLSAVDYSVMIADYPELGPMASTLEIPSSSINPLRVEMYGKSRAWPGRRISSDNSLNITFLLNRATGTYQQLIAIRNSFSEGNTGNIVGRFFDLRVVHYDEVGVEAMVITFNDCWLSEVGGYSLDASAESQLLMCPCIFYYTTTSYEFTGMGTVADRVIASVINRITDSVVNVGSKTDRFGSFPSLADYSQQLVGRDPLDLVSQRRSALANAVGFTLGDLTKMSNVISSVRNALSGGESKLSRIASAVKTKDYASVAASIKSLAGIRSKF